MPKRHPRPNRFTRRASSTPTSSKIESRSRSFGCSRSAHASIRRTESLRGGEPARRRGPIFLGESRAAASFLDRLAGGFFDSLDLLDARSKESLDGAHAVFVAHRAGDVDESRAKERGHDVGELFEMFFDPGVGRVARRASRGDRDKDIAKILGLDRAIKREQKHAINELR